MIVCFFDIDGTLLNTGGAGQAAMESALAAEFQAGGPVRGISFAGRTDRAIVADFFRYFGVEPGEKEWQRFLRAYLEHLPIHLNRREGVVLPGISRLLEELSRRDNVSLGLLTGNFREGARLKLQHYQLDDYFAYGGFGDEHHHRDEVAREALAAAERHHGTALAAERVFVIGDTPADVQCARAIGARSIAVATGIYPADELAPAAPDHLFPDFSDADAVLDLLVL